MHFEEFNCFNLSQCDGELVANGLQSLEQTGFTQVFEMGSGGHVAFDAVMSFAGKA